MTDVLEKLAACERAENEGRAYPFFPEIWGEARAEVERLRAALKDISDPSWWGGNTRRDDLANRMVRRARTALGEKE